MNEKLTPEAPKVEQMEGNVESAASLESAEETLAGEVTALEAESAQKHEEAVDALADAEGAILEAGSGLDSAQTAALQEEIGALRAELAPEGAAVENAETGSAADIIKAFKESAFLTDADPSEIGRILAASPELWSELPDALDAIVDRELSSDGSPQMVVDSLNKIYDAMQNPDKGPRSLHDAMKEDDKRISDAFQKSFGTAQKALTTYMMRHNPVQEM